VSVIVILCALGYYAKVYRQQQAPDSSSLKLKHKGLAQMKDYAAAATTKAVQIFDEALKLDPNNEEIKSERDAAALKANKLATKVHRPPPRNTPVAKPTGPSPVAEGVPPAGSMTTNVDGDMP
jgi:hypothetical protein